MGQPRAHSLGESEALQARDLPPAKLLLLVLDSVTHVRRGSRYRPPENGEGKRLYRRSRGHGRPEA